MSPEMEFTIAALRSCTTKVVDGWGKVDLVKAQMAMRPPPFTPTDPLAIELNRLLDQMPSAYERHSGATRLKGWLSCLSRKGYYSKGWIKMGDLP